MRISYDHKKCKFIVLPIENLQILSLEASVLLAFLVFKSHHKQFRIRRREEILNTLRFTPYQLRTALKELVAKEFVTLKKAKRWILEGVILRISTQEEINVYENPENQQDNQKFSRKSRPSKPPPINPMAPSKPANPRPSITQENDDDDNEFSNIKTLDDYYKEYSRLQIILQRTPPGEKKLEIYSKIVRLSYVKERLLKKGGKR